MSDNDREKVWVCVPCGRWHDERDKIGGQECYDNAVYCYLDSCKFGDGGPRVSHIGELVCPTEDECCVRAMKKIDEEATGAK